MAGFDTSLKEDLAERSFLEKAVLLVLLMGPAVYGVYRFFNPTLIGGSGDIVIWLFEAFAICYLDYRILDDKSKGRW